MPAARRGFTIVELLVVVAIIAILMSLLLPAVQASRETARSLSCKNNLRNLGLACHTYWSANGAFPVAGFVDPKPKQFEPRSGRQFSWVVLILPHLEQQALRDQFDLSKSVFQQPLDPQSTPLEIMLCPGEDAGRLALMDSSLTSGKRFAKGNYAAFVSPFHVELCWLYPSVIGGNVRTSDRTVRDGLTNTLMLAEIRTRAQVQDQRGAWALPWTGASLLAFDMHSVGNTAVPFKASTVSLGQTQLPNCQGPNRDVLYECPQSAAADLEKMPCLKHQAGTANDFLSAAPRSRHPGGVNVAFGDGRVAFLPDTVNEIVMSYLIAPDDGQVIAINKVVQ